MGRRSIANACDASYVRGARVGLAGDTAAAVEHPSGLAEQPAVIGRA